MPLTLCDPWVTNLTYGDFSYELFFLSAVTIQMHATTSLMKTLERGSNGSSSPGEVEIFRSNPEVVHLLNSLKVLYQQSK